MKTQDEALQCNNHHLKLLCENKLKSLNALVCRHQDILSLDFNIKTTISEN